ncbi:glycosyl hydrolase [Prolixibacteraceae bacterium JC049]|nr:glycosyl hydrolase [Prolixibacteraceae bacterium JC049]
MHFKLYSLTALALGALIAISPINAEAKKKKQTEKKEVKDTLKSMIGGLKFRNIGPAWASGRIADFAVNPNNHSEYYVAVASGNLWKTTNNGTTWKPIFENYGSYSLGVVKLDPNNSNVVWVGTGENNHQRALGYGDGVYKSVDGGKSFKNMGLKESRQIGGIVVDPRNSNVVFVAAEGSAWGAGGDRGLYKTTDGGKNWKKVLEISEHTGVNNVVIDPSNPDIMYATSEQRRRHVHTKIGGGPESSVYKSTDGGENWRKINKGLPGVHKGGMGIAVSPVDPNVVYLIVEAAENKGGFYRSTNKGESWEKMSSHASSGQYYNEIYCDPKDVDKVFSVETFTHYTTDGGKTWKRVSTNGRHVDDHALWIDPTDTNHYIIGGDGGIYETWDFGKTFDFKENLPITQFYRVAVDNDLPFYNVYGGTQDNNSMGGPSRNISRGGVTSDEWWVTQGGDGFWQAIDPTDPNIVYSEYQYGNMFRFDRKSRESLSIKPREKEGELTYKWNWNAPLFISPHNHKRIYCAANKVFRSDNQGDAWETISDDLTAQMDRNTWKTMGKYWSIDAVKKDVSTSQFGTIVSLDESPVQEDLLVAGTDDGVISITEDAGKTWNQVKKFEGIPEYTYVSDLMFDRFDANTIYATFDNRKRDDFRPYVLKSTDKGKTWKSISATLPKNGTVHTIAQDHVNPKLLFVGTEFGFFFSNTAGEKWTQIKSGLPTIAVRDITIQQRENDIAIATFGRGFYILDNYTPLRHLTKENLNAEGFIFPVKDALMYIQSSSRGNQGNTYYKAKNPEFGATFTYYLKSNVEKSAAQKRKESEKKLFKDGKAIPQPTWREVELEKQEEAAHLIFTITDENGNVVRQLNGSPSKGMHRINWNLRLEGYYPVNISGKFNPTKQTQSGILAMPGKYFVSMSVWNDSQLKKLTEPVAFNVVPLNNKTIKTKDRKALVAFGRKVNKLAGTIYATRNLISDLTKKVESMKKAIYDTPEATQELMDKARKLASELEEVRYAMSGDKAKASSEEVPPSKPAIMGRLGNISWSHYRSTADVTSTEKEQYRILSKEFKQVLSKVKDLAENKVPALQSELKKIGAPLTPGIVPEWNE